MHLQRPSEEYYKRKSAIPFLDHVISNFESRCSSLARTAFSLLCLVPSIICSEQISWGEVVDAYEEDFPSPELVDMEVGRWKAKYQCLRPQDRPDSLAAAIKDCDPDCFPNLRILLQLACTLPVTSCECERSASCITTLAELHASHDGR